MTDSGETTGTGAAGSPPLGAHQLVNVWLAGFTADAALGMVDEAVALGVDIHPLWWLRQLTAFVLLLLTVGVMGGAAVSPRVPLRVVLPPLVWNLWAALGALPVVVWTLLSGSFGVALTGLQLVAALGGVLGAVSLGGRPWLTPATLAGRRGLSWVRPVGVVLALPVVLAASALWVMLNVQYAVSWSSSGYVSVDLQGLYMSTRTLTRDERRVHLVGMVHMAEAGSFAELFDGFADVDGAVVLTEGVSDRQRLLAQEGPLYEKMARRLGLEDQPRVEASGGATVRRADVDLSDLSPEAITLLRGLTAFYASEDMVASYGKLSGVIDGLGGAEAVFDLLLDQLVRLRNDRLEAEVGRALVDHQVVIVPWGALHLPDLEARLVADGFSRTAEERRLVVRHATWLAAVGRLVQ
ncbi:MAG: hypothetical protein ACI8PZ_003776 [Myxococcota bacterium]|jgi:hypothetical protein